jgi:tetratricopeptide (TPR) repeat protein
MRFRVRGGGLASSPRPIPTHHPEGFTASRLWGRAAGLSTIVNTIGRWITAGPALPLALGVVTMAVFLPGLGNDFVDWDDHVNFIDNQDFRGLAWKNLRWMFTTALLGQWIPLSWLTLGLDYSVWGMNPVGYHLTNVLLHALGAVVFYFVARRLLAAATDWNASVLAISAAAATLFFSIHPLRAESVAWATERRDVLSGAWFLLTVLTYLKAHDAGKRRGRWLTLSVGCFVLAVLSKSIVVTLPVVLLVLDVYPLRRIGSSPKAWLSRQVWCLWLEKLPYFVLAAAAIGMAFWAQRVNQFLTPLSKLSVADRLIVVVHSLWFYLTTTVMPIGLVPVYELPVHISWLDRRFVVSSLGVALLVIGLAFLRHRWPAGVAVGAAYAIMLSPVSGIFHNGHQLVHDRYSYLPCLGWALLFGAGLGAILRAAVRGTLRPALARLTVAASVLVLAGHASMTVHQVGVWRDTDSLWRFALENDPNCGLCHNNLGALLLRRGRPDLALTELNMSITLRPDRVGTNGNIALAYLRLDRPAEAIEYAEKVLRVNPRDVDNRCNLAVALMEDGRLDDAMRELRTVLNQDPNHFGGILNTGVALIEARRAVEALPYLERALALKPNVPQVRAGLLRAWLALGRPDLARAEYSQLRKLDDNAASRLAPLLLAESG